MVGAAVDALAPGSYLVLSQSTPDFDPEAMRALAAASEQGGIANVPRSLADTERVIAAAKQHDVLLMEAYMYRFHPQTRRVVELVRSALQEFPIDQPMRIRVNPTDLSAISRATSDGRDPLQILTRDRDARWLPDASIAPGGCIVEGRERIVDGRVDIALERIYRRLTYTNA